METNKEKAADDAYHARHERDAQFAQTATEEDTITVSSMDLAYVIDGLLVMTDAFSDQKTIDDGEWGSIKHTLKEEIADLIKLHEHWRSYIVERTGIDIQKQSKEKLLPEEVDSRCSIEKEIVGEKGIAEAQLLVSSLIRAYDEKMISKGLIKSLKIGIEKSKPEYLKIIENKFKHDVLIRDDIEIDRDKTNSIIKGILLRGLIINEKLLTEALDMVNEKLRP